LTEQLSFDFDDRLSIGDLVEVTARPREGQDVETYFYLSEHKGKKGELIRIIKGKKVCFEVKYPDGSLGVFYENEIRKIGGIRNEKTIRKTKSTSSRTNRKKRNA
jgi:hypothetical protein